MNHDPGETCRTEGCEMNGVTLTGVDAIPADIPVHCGVCGHPIS
jgi:hypothetical protein